jgi:hypothetical protein
MERVAKAPEQPEQVDVGDRVPPERPLDIPQAAIRDAEDAARMVDALAARWTATGP